MYNLQHVDKKEMLKEYRKCCLALSDKCCQIQNIRWEENATDVADYLVKKGQNFRDAHHIAARLVKYAIEKNLTLEELDLGVYKQESNLFEDDIYQAIDLETCLKMRKSKGGSAPEEVLRQICYVEREITIK